MIYDIPGQPVILQPLIAQPPTRTDFICKAYLTYTARRVRGYKFFYILEKNVFKKREQQFLFKFTGLMYLFIHLVFKQYGITDFICTFFSVHVLFLKLYAQFFFFSPVHAIRPKLGSDSCIPAVLSPLFISIWTVYLEFKVGAFHAVFSLALRLCEQLHLILYMKGVQISRFGSIHS